MKLQKMRLDQRLSISVLFISLFNYWVVPILKMVDLLHKFGMIKVSRK